MAARLRYLYRAYRYRYWVDRAELRFLCARLKPGQVAVDVGCHKGAYTYWMQRCVGPRGSVYAFEPQPQQANYLRRVFDATRYHNVTLLPLALSDSVGRRSLYMPTGSTHDATLEQGVGGNVSQTQFSASSPMLRTPRSTFTVEVTTLDEFFAHQSRGPHFVKIDVEGHELMVIEGARQTLSRYHPTMIVECEARHRPDGDVRPVFELLESLGYVGSFFWNGRRLAIADFDSAVHQRLDPVSHRPAGRYANNFVFESCQAGICGDS
jgi:FkbM family methyltransferase